VIKVQLGRFRSNRALIAFAAIAMVAVAAWLLRPRDQADVVKIAYSFPDGGGYCALSDSGVLQPVLFNGVEVLRKSKAGSYCCGFTFMVAMQAAEARGLLKDKDGYEIKRFQREWYGATKVSAERQAALAVENLKIGREVDPLDAQSGDFVVFSRRGGSGHSVIFLNWIKHEKTIVGLHYRSSQPETSGLGDQSEYFISSHYRGASIDPAHFHVARLNH
jgi:hypothetical protein